MYAVCTYISLSLATHHTAGAHGTKKAANRAKIHHDARSGERERAATRIARRARTLASSNKEVGMQYKCIIIQMHTCTHIHTHIRACTSSYTARAWGRARGLPGAPAQSIATATATTTTATATAKTQNPKWKQKNQNQNKQNKRTKKHTKLQTKNYCQVLFIMYVSIFVDIV